MPCIALPGGIWCEDAGPNPALRRELRIRQPDGEDEAWLLGRPPGSTPSELATALVARCLVGEADPAATANSLAVGDREAVLLQLRRLVMGEQIEAVLPCPADGCGERLEIELRVSDLLVPQYPVVSACHRLNLRAGDADYEVEFRLPTARDLDAVADRARRDPTAGAAALLQACMRSGTCAGKPVAVTELPAEVIEGIAVTMAELDPQAELDLELHCPACGTEFSLAFDTAAFLVQELSQRAGRLLHEVHVLAWHYHWGEADILRLPAARRSFYLERIGETAARTAIR